MGTYAEDIKAAMTAQVNEEMWERRWSQVEMSKRSGIPTSTLSRYLKGEREMTVTILGEIAEALGLSVWELAGRAQARLEG